MSKGVSVIYCLESIDSSDGVDVFAIAPVLMHFGELIRSANTVLGGSQKIDVRVRPFAEGSWITEFLLRNGNDLINYLRTDSGKEVALILNLLGFNVVSGLKGVADIIRFTRGKVANFRKTGDTITYYSEKGEMLTVSQAEHNLVQSPLIQNNYYSCVINPLERFPTATAISIRARIDGAQSQTFTRADKPAFEEYVKAEVLGDVEQNVSSMNGVFVKPRRGSYGGEQAYSFMLGDSILYPVTIEDDAFIRGLQTGETRLYAEDVLRVDLETKQKRDSANKIQASYSIKKVLEYIKYEKPKQLGMEDIAISDIKKIGH